MELCEGLGRVFGIFVCGFVSYVFFELRQLEYRYRYMLLFEILAVISLLLCGYAVYDFFKWLFT